MNRGANWVPAAGEVPKTNGGEEAEEGAAAGAVEEKERSPGEVAELVASAVEEEEAMVRYTKLER